MKRRAFDQCPMGNHSVVTSATGLISPMKAHRSRGRRSCSIGSELYPEIHEQRPLGRSIHEGGIQQWKPRWFCSGACVQRAEGPPEG